MGKNVLVSGACGRMGQEVVRTIVQETNDNLIGAYDKKDVGANIISKLGLDAPEAKIYGDLQQAIDQLQPEVIIDFTSPEVVMENIELALKNKVHMIVGTTGITEADMEKISDWSHQANKNILIVPNFALGAVLLMKYSAQIAKYMNQVEIIELHHDEKIDAPSGTAVKTAELINQNRDNNQEKKVEEIEKLKGARGGKKDDLHIHSVRLPGLVAHQEVIFGGEGQTLKLRHDSYDRKSFMPGVRMALEKIEDLDGLVYGLEHLLD